VYDTGGPLQGIAMKTKRKKNRDSLTRPSARHHRAGCGGSQAREDRPVWVAARGTMGRTVPGLLVIKGGKFNRHRAPCHLPAICSGAIGLIRGRDF